MTKIGCIPFAQQRSGVRMRTAAQKIWPSHFRAGVLNGVQVGSHEFWAALRPVKRVAIRIWVVPRDTKARPFLGRAFIILFRERCNNEKP